MKKRLILASTMSLTLLLEACAPSTVWVKPGSTVTNWRLDSYNSNM